MWIKNIVQGSTMDFILNKKKYLQYSFLSFSKVHCMMIYFLLHWSSRHMDRALHLTMYLQKLTVDIINFLVD
jgi:hypothetical protein